MTLSVTKTRRCNIHKMLLKRNTNLLFGKISTQCRWNRRFFKELHWTRTISFLFEDMLLLHIYLLIDCLNSTFDYFIEFKIPVIDTRVSRIPNNDYKDDSLT